MSRRGKDIPVSRTRVDDRTTQPAEACAFPGCGRPADYRAPRNPQNLNSYVWFCLEHVQAYNRSWDFFRGMSPEEIERYRVEAVTGHRPTWKLGDRGLGIDGFQFDDKLGILRDRDGAAGAAHAAAAEPPLEPKCRKALAELELDATATLQEVKLRYKQLVKRYHPDANGGDKRAEERFKTINEAYNILLTAGLS